MINTTPATMQDTPSTIDPKRSRARQLRRLQNRHAAVLAARDAIVARLAELDAEIAKLAPELTQPDPVR